MYASRLEPLSLSSLTLVFNNVNSPQEKVGKLNVIHKKRPIAGLKAAKDAYKTIGVVTLQLQALADGQCHAV
jgi:hypothetical protein